jgi:hypothetical protein
MIGTLPRGIDQNTINFCRSISPHDPVFIPSRPGKNAVPSHCFDNSAAKVKRSKGSVMHGWAIWHVPGLYFEAEHHGIWRKADGTLLDVSPQIFDYDRILFLPDPDAVYDPANIRDNIFVADGDSAEALAVVELAGQRNAIYKIYRSDDDVTIADFSAEHQSMLADLHDQFAALLETARPRELA